MDKVTNFKDAVKATQQAQQVAAKLNEDISVVDDLDIDKKTLEKSHEELVKEMITWQRRYSEVALVNNRHVDIINQLMYFLAVQCGVLYTAITGVVVSDDPLKEISEVETVNFDASQEDLHYFRKGLIIYLTKLQENGEIEEAYQAWLKYMNS